MWIIRTALRSPYTFIVMAFLIALFGVIFLVSMPADVFPEIQIPVVSAIWTYSGMSAVGVNQARVQRIRELVSYERVVAPFPGVITARNIDIGSLVSAGSNAAVPVLYRLGRLDRLRIFVDVPQADSEYVHEGQTCSIQVPELSGRIFTAQVTRFAHALDPASRTMRTEVQLDNSSGELLPGMYAEVRFDFVRKQSPILIPANALVASPSGDEVVVVRNGVAHFQPVRVGVDYGAQVEIDAGVSIGDDVVENVNEDIRDGSKVKAIPASTGPA